MVLSDRSERSRWSLIHDRSRHGGSIDTQGVDPATRQRDLVQIYASLVIMISDLFMVR